MAAKGSFNIFQQGSAEPDRQKASNMFSFISTEENGNQRPRQSQTVSKRQTFRNEIRLQKNQQIRKVMRDKLLKSLESSTIFTLLESLISKENLDSKNISNLITDLRRNISDLEFCKKLNEQTEIKKFMLNLYLNNQEHLNLEQKCVLISCLTYLTFYNMKTFDLEQKQKLNDTMIKEISQINQYDELHIQYLRKNIDLLTNIISDEDADINHYLLDTSLFAEIGSKITKIANQGQKMAELNQNDEEICIRYEYGLDDIRDAFISALLNLSFPQYANDSFFEFTMGQLVGDINYLRKNGVKTLKILSNFFVTQKFRLRFIHTYDLAAWFEIEVSNFCQQKFINPQEQKNGHFLSTKLTLQEREIFYEFIKCMRIFIEEETEEEILQSFSHSIQFTLNFYCLSQFLIQCSQNDPHDQNLYRNSKYVSEAIKMYEFLADYLRYDLPKLLIVTSERNVEDIFKVLLNETYFTSHKISDVTISLLNKILGKQCQWIHTLVELGIFESIDIFISKRNSVQTPEQISNFFDLLTLMVDSETELKNRQGEKNKINTVVAKLDQYGLIQKIADYQDHENRQVSERALGFLEFIESFQRYNEKYLNEI